MADYDIFREQLGIRYPAYGHALWDASPDIPDIPVEIGDVGFIRMGKFHRLFNALLPADDASQDLGVPEHYEQLQVDPKLKDRHISKSFLSCDHYTSAGVHVVPDLQYYSRSPDDFRDVSFTCPERRGGAILSLPVKARRADTLAKRDFKDWILKNIDGCFAFVRQLGLGIEQMEDIILVTGYDRTRSWTNVAFLGDQKDAHASFRVKVVDARDTSNLIQFLRGHREGASLSLGPEGKNLPENQCVFIRGFRVTRTFKFLPKRLIGAAGPSEPPEPEGYDCEPDTEVISIPAATKYRDPLHVILDYVAERAYDCDMVLVHDDDLEWVNGIGSGTSLVESLQSEVFMDFLRKSNIEVRKVRYDLMPTSSSPNDDTCVIWVAMLSTPPKNWNIGAPSQLLPSVAPYGPSPTSRPPEPFPRNSDSSFGSYNRPIQGDTNLRYGGGKFGRAANVSLITLGDIRSSPLTIWPNLYNFAHEKRNKLVSTVVVVSCLAVFLGWIFSLTLIAYSKLFFTLLAASFTFAAFLERIEGLQHYISNSAGAGLLDAARTFLPIAPRRVPSTLEPLFEQRTQADRLKHDEPLAITSRQIKVSTPQEDSSETAEGPTIDFDITEQRDRQLGLGMDTAFSHWSLNFPFMKKRIEHLTAGTSLLRQPEIVQNVPPNLALRRSGMRLLMCSASLSTADFASPEGYLGPSDSTPYYPTGDLQGDRNFAYSSTMNCLDALDVLLAVKDRGKIAAKQSELAQSFNDLGLHEYASMTSNSALELARDMYAVESDDFRLRVASIQSLRANILVDLKKNDQAVAAADEAISLYKEHGRHRGVSVPELAHTCLEYSVLLCSIGLRDEGAAMALELLKPDEIGQDNEYISSLGELCLSNSQIGIDNNLALSAAEKAIRYCRTQSDVNVRAVLAGALLTKSKILSRHRRDDEAYSFSFNAVVLLHDIRKERPVFSLILAHALDTFSHQLFEASLKKESYLAAREAVGVWEALRVAAPGPITRPLAWALFHLAKFRQKGADMETILQELLTSGHAVRMFSEASTLDAGGLADALYLFSDRLLELDKKDEAAIFSEQSVRYFQKAASQAPEKYTLDLIFSLSLASSCLASVARADDALEYAKRAVAIQRERVGAVGYDTQLRRLLADVVLRFTEAGKQKEALTWVQELQALDETRGIEALTAPVHPSDQGNWGAHVKKETSYWVDTSDAAPELDDDHTLAEAQRRIVIPGSIDPLLNVLNAGRHDLMSSLIEFGDLGLAKLVAHGSGSGGHPDSSRLQGIGNMGKFTSLAEGLRASFGPGGERQMPDIFRPDSDLSVNNTDGSKDGRRDDY